MRLVELARAAGADGAREAWQRAAPLAGVTTDSRRAAAGKLFVALRGPRFDGHDFVAAAVAAGAAAVMVEASAAHRWAAAGDGQGGPAAAHRVPCLVVQDTLRALGDMAAHWRRGWGGPTVGVTGSNGKTSTCALAAAALSCGGEVHRTEGNLNNLIGVPLTLLARPATAWAQVVEMGMNAPGEIARLAAIARPSVALVTCVDVAHLGGPGLGSLAAIAAAKAEIFTALTDGEVAVVNADDVALAAALPAAWPRGVRRLTFGRAAGCDVRLCRAEVGPRGCEVELEVVGSRHRLALPWAGAHHGMNAAAAAAAAVALGVPTGALAALERATPPPGRCRLRRLEGAGVTLIDDTYNANPGSLRAAVRLLVALPGHRRRLLAVGDMGELGPQGPALHAEVGGWLAAQGVDEVWTLGPLAASLAAALRAAGGRAHPCPDMTALTHAVAGALAAGDALLVKGSRSMRMERLVEALAARDAGPKEA